MFEEAVLRLGVFFGVEFDDDLVDDVFDHSHESDSESKSWLKSFKIYVFLPKCHFHSVMSTFHLLAPLQVASLRLALHRLHKGGLNLLQASEVEEGIEVEEWLQEVAEP